MGARLSGRRGRLVELVPISWHYARTLSRILVVILMRPNERSWGDGDWASRGPLVMRGPHSDDVPTWDLDARIRRRWVRRRMQVHLAFNREPINQGQVSVELEIERKCCRPNQFFGFSSQKEKDAGELT